MGDEVPTRGLLGADAALAALAQDPARLERARARFNESPPPYRQYESLPTTASQPSPGDENDEEKRLDDWLWRILNARGKSWPDEQFKAQKMEEYDKLFQPVSSSCVGDQTLIEESEDTIKARWQALGLWEDEWSRRPRGRWRHEMPLKSEPPSDAEPDDGQTNIFQPRKPPRPPKTQEEQQKSEERRKARFAARAHAHELTRPYHQFVGQVSQERDRILAAQKEENRADGGASSRGDDGSRTIPHDINTTAYETVKGLWTKRGIWNNSWGILPGMTWKHEHAREDVVREEMGEDFARLSERSLESLKPVSIPKPTNPPRFVPPRLNYFQRPEVAPRYLPGGNLFHSNNHDGDTEGGAQEPDVVPRELPGGNLFLSGTVNNDAEGSNGPAMDAQQLALETEPEPASAPQSEQEEPGPVRRRGRQAKAAPPPKKARQAARNVKATARQTRKTTAEPDHNPGEREADAAAPQPSPNTPSRKSSRLANKRQEQVTSDVPEDTPSITKRRRKAAQDEPPPPEAAKKTKRAAARKQKARK